MGRYLVVTATQRECAADDGRVGREELLPNVMAEHDDRRTTRLSLVVSEGPARHRLDTEGFEVRGRDRASTQKNRFPVPEQRGRLTTERGHM